MVSKCAKTIDDHIRQGYRRGESNRLPGPGGLPRISEQGWLRPDSTHDYNVPSGFNPDETVRNGPAIFTLSSRSPPGEDTFTFIPPDVHQESSSYPPSFLQPMIRWAYNSRLEQAFRNAWSNHAVPTSEEKIRQFSKVPTLDEDHPLSTTFPGRTL